MRWGALALAFVVCAPFTAVAKPAKKKKPTGDEWPPKVVTQRLMRQLAAGKQPLAALVDPARGVIFVEFTEGVDGGKDVKRARKLCGDELTKQLPKWVKLMKSTIDSDESVMISCSNIGGHDCGIGGDDMTPTFHLRFVDDATRGLALDAVVDVSEANMGESWQKAAKKFIDAKLKELAAPCPAEQKAAQ